MIRALRNYLAWRRERRQRYRKARHNALLMVIGGTVQPPGRKAAFKRS